MAAIRSFRDLNTYRKTREEVKRIFDLTRGFPRSEQFALTDQVRRSSRAVKAMIAEAWAKRRYKAAFVSKLTDAMGEAMETQSWLDDALDSNYISAEQQQDHDAVWQGIGGMLNRMIERADDFCSQHER